MISATIRGISVTVGNASFRLEDPLEDRAILTFTVLDSAGTASYTRGDPVTFADPDVSLSYTGYVQSDQPTKDGLALPYVEHNITCMDGVYNLDKRSNNQNYFNWQAGTIAVDFVRSTLASEGITIAAAMHRDTTDSDFNHGNLSGMIGTINASDDGDLEIAKAGTDLTISESLASDFSSGTLTNMQVVGNTLQPTTVNALKLQSTLSFSFGTEFAQSQQSTSGTISGSGSGTASGSVSPSGSYTPSGTIFISGGNPGESATFSGNFATINTTGSFSAPVSMTVSGTTSGTVTPTYQPKTKSTVKVDDTHYKVTTVDQAVNDNRVDAEIWTGSIVLGSSDTLNYDIWISSTSPSMEAGVDLFFSDGTVLTEYLGSLGTNTDTGVWDQNGVSVTPTQDLSDYAKDTWYTRQIDLSLLSGMTITAVSVFNAANVAGTYDVYVKNCYLTSHSGSPFFGTASTAPSVNPPVISSIGSYITASTLVTVVPVYNPAQSSRVSTAHSIDGVKLVQSSLISWIAANPVVGPGVVAGSVGAATVAGSEAVFVSYDGTTWLTCSNNQALPGLPAGANIASTSLYLKETFTGGQDPTAIPTLESVVVSIVSAPHATTTDVVSQYGTSTAWNSGTELGVAPNGSGDLALSTTSYSWSNLNNMTYVPGNASASNPTQSVSSGAYVISSPGSSGSSWTSTRFNFISAAQNFTAEADFTLNGGASPSQNEIGYVYRQTYWDSPNNSFAYYVRIMQAPGGHSGGTSVTLGYGINSPPTSAPVGGGPASGTFTVINQQTVTITNNTTYHVKLVVTGNRHTIYWNGSGTPLIDVLDNTYTQSGNIGIRTFVDSSNSTTNKIANFTITNTFAGLWKSPSIPLSSLGTCGNTQIAWSETTAAGAVQSTALVMASLDGGTTWQQCTNGAISPTTSIPGLPSGTNVSGKSLIIQVVLSSTGHLIAPIITGLLVRVCGAYPGSSGTRDTAPLGNDMSITRTVGSGWGTAFDGQTWTQAGTGATAVGSNVETISSTTGTVYMRLGSRTGTDLDGTHRFSLSSSGMTEGIFLRYIDTNNYYALAASTSGVSILKRIAGVTTTLKSVSTALAINTKYRMRFRVVGYSPVSLSGNVWADGAREPTVNGAGQWDDSQWVITASD